jgi:hypothetical protein
VDVSGRASIPTSSPQRARSAVGRNQRDPWSLRLSTSSRGNAFGISELTSSPRT